MLKRALDRERKRIYHARNEKRAGNGAANTSRGTETVEVLLSAMPTEEA